MKTQTNLPYLDDSKIDPTLVNNYTNRDKFNPIKRLIVEYKYNKAVGKALKEDYDRAKIKDN